MNELTYACSLYNLLLTSDWPASFDYFFQIIAVNVLVNIFAGAVKVLAKWAAISPRFVIDVVCFIVSIARVHTLWGIHEPLVKLHFTSCYCFRWQAQSNLLTNVSFTISLKFGPINQYQPKLFINLFKFYENCNGKTSWF